MEPIKPPAKNQQYIFPCPICGKDLPPLGAEHAARPPACAACHAASEAANEARNIKRIAMGYHDLTDH